MKAANRFTCRFFRKTITLLIILGLLAVLCSCQKKADKTIKIGLLSIDDSLPFFMAESLGLYEKHNVKVELYSFQSASDKEAAFEAGELDADMTDIVVAALINKGGTKAKIVCNALGAIPKEGRFMLLSSPNSGIKTPQELADTEIAVGDNTIVHYLADTICKMSGIPKENTKTTNIPSLAIRLEALLNGSIKAAVLPDPLASLALANGANCVFDDTSSEKNLSQSIVLFSESAISEKSDEITKCLAAYFEAMEYINSNPNAEDVRNAISEFTSVPMSIFESYNTPSYSPKTLPSKEVIEDTMNWMLEKELLEKPYSYEELVSDIFAK